jgi:hypothetical protein
MNAHHQYPTRITHDIWTDLLAIQKITTKSINVLLNEGAIEVVKKTKQELGHYRKDRETVRSVAASR